MAEHVQDILLSEIMEDGSTQLREKLEAWRVADLAAAYTDDPEKIPPITLFRDKSLAAGKKYWTGNGNHRLAGCRKAGRKSIRAVIQDGDHRAAVLFAASANADQDTNGLPRSREDKRKAVSTLLKDKEWGQRSSNWIADACKVSHTFVEKLRQEPTCNVASSTTDNGGRQSARTGKDNRQRPAGQGDASESTLNGTGQKSTGKGGGKPAKGPKPGAEVINWLKVWQDKVQSPLTRFEDDFVRPGQGHPEEKQTSDYYAYQRLRREIVACVERWWKKVKGQKARKT